MATMAAISTDSCMQLMVANQTHLHTLPIPVFTLPYQQQQQQ